MTSKSYPPKILPQLKINKMIINFKEKLPEFGDSNHDNTKTITKNPHRIFASRKISDGVTFFDMTCRCADPDCKNEISFNYHGLNRYGGSRNLGSDTEVYISSRRAEDEKRSSSVMWNPSEENVAQFTAFCKTAREAISFKKELLRGLYAELQVSIKGCDDILIMVRREETEFLFLLFEIPNVFPKVPLLRESESYRECLGVIATLPTDTDISEIRNAYADMRNSFFKPITEWINLLGKENGLILTVINIWVMPE